MDNKTFNIIYKSVKSYMKSLNIDEVREEFTNSDLLNSNKKLSKGENLNVGLELLPSVLGIYANTCGAEGQCKYTCLAFTGQGNILKTKSILAGDLSPTLKKRARRTFLYFNDNAFFEEKLKIEIEANSRVAALKKQQFAVRLNVFSDIDWTHITNSMPNIQFYDYTKHFDRKSTPNYKLTFSASEKTSQETIIDKLSTGENVAMVFNKTLPKEYFGFAVIDGDKTDDRYNDLGAQVIGLKMKTPVGGKTLTKFIFTNEMVS